MTFEQVMLAYFRHLQSQGKYLGTDKHNLNHLLPLFQGRDISTITWSDVQTYVTQRQAQGIKGSTINRETSLITRAWNYTAKVHQLPLKSPVLYKQPEPEPPIVYLTKKEAQRLIEAAQTEPKAQHLVDFIHIALFTGARTSEILKAEWTRLDLNENLLYLGTKDQKNRTLGSLVLSKKPIKAILNRKVFNQQNCPNSPWIFAHPNGDKIQSIKTAFNTAVKRAKIKKHVTPHTLRHTFITWLVQSGQPLAHVQQSARHKKIEMTIRYTHLAPNDVRQTIEVLTTIYSIEK